MTGPIEDRQWPQKLTAHVVDDSGGSPRLHGFDVQGDLARHYSFSETLLVALTADAPDAATGRAFEVALTFASTTSVAEAPAHAATLARICGAQSSAILAVAATILGEQARSLCDELEPAIPRLLIGSLNGMTAALTARSESERAAVQRLREALGEFVRNVPSIGYDIRLDVAIVAVLVACGLRRREHIEAAFVIARLGVAFAEALATTPGDHRSYPLDLPSFRYEAS
jgi:hypothetical protein